MVIYYNLLGVRKSITSSWVLQSFCHHGFGCRKHLLCSHSITMASIVESILYLSFLWTCLILALIFLQLIKEYLKAKPPGSQTLLDKTYLQLFSSFQVVIFLRLGFTTVYHLEIDFGDPQSTILAWIIYLSLDHIMFSMLAMTLTNIASVYTPYVLETVTEQTFNIGLLLSTFMMASATTLTTWGFEWCNLAYFYLRQNEADVCLPITTVRLILTLFGFATTSCFKLSLMCSRNVLSEGERNLLSSKVILVLASPVLIIKIINSIIPSYTALIVTIGMNLYMPFVPLTVLCVSENVRRFVWRKVCNLFDLNFVPSNTVPSISNRAQNSVAPEIYKITNTPDSQQ